jgi:hypothetical protein
MLLLLVLLALLLLLLWNDDTILVVYRSPPTTTVRGQTVLLKVQLEMKRFIMATSCHQLPTEKKGRPFWAQPTCFDANPSFQTLW